MSIHQPIQNYQHTRQFLRIMRHQHQVIRIQQLDQPHQIVLARQGSTSHINGDSTLTHTTDSLSDQEIHKHVEQQRGNDTPLLHTTTHIKPSPNLPVKSHSGLSDLMQIFQQTDQLGVHTVQF
jgi:hypothetical protein